MHRGDIHISGTVASSPEAPGYNRAPRSVGQFSALQPQSHGFECCVDLLTAVFSSPDPSRPPLAKKIPYPTMHLHDRKVTGLPYH